MVPLRHGKGGRSFNMHALIALRTAFLSLLGYCPRRSYRLTGDRLALLKQHRRRQTQTAHRSHLPAPSLLKFGEPLLVLNHGGDPECGSETNCRDCTLDPLRCPSRSRA